MPLSEKLVPRELEETGVAKEEEHRSLLTFANEIQ